jgi:hypothetical protein
MDLLSALIEGRRWDVSSELALTPSNCCAAAKMAEAGRGRILQLPHRADQQSRTNGVPHRDHQLSGSSVSEAPMPLLKGAYAAQEVDTPKADKINKT